MGRCGRLRARRLCSLLAWGILASWMLRALKQPRSDRPKTLPYLASCGWISYPLIGVRVKIAKLQIFDDCEVAIRMQSGQW